MIKMLLIVEFPDLTTEAEAQAQLDFFREAVLPGETYGMTVYRPTFADINRALDAVEERTQQNLFLETSQFPSWSPDFGKPYSNPT